MPTYVAITYVNILQSKVYAVMEYHDQPLQYINRYYFRTKTEGDDHYDVIYNIMSFMGALPLGLWIGFTMLAIAFVVPQVSTLLMKLSLAQLKEVELDIKKLNKAENKDVQVKKRTEGENKNCVYLVELKSTVYEQELLKMTRTNGAYVRKVKGECKKYTIDLSASNKWKIDRIPLLILSISLNIALFAFHILSAVEIIKYGNDVLQSHQDSSKDHSSSPTATVTISFIMIIATYISAVLISVYRLHKGLCFDTKSLLVALNFLASMSVTINIIHIVCYFLPYMLLAFIYNPLQTCVTYLALGFYALGAYLLLWIAKYCITSYIKLFNFHTSVNDLIGGSLGFYAPESYTAENSESVDGKDIKRVRICSCIVFYTVFVLFATGMVLAVVYFSAAILYVLTLGSLNDFEVIQNLVPPLLIGLLTYFVIKPTYKQAKQNINLDDESRIEKLHTKEDTQIEIRHDSTDLQHIETSK